MNSKQSSNNAKQSAKNTLLADSNNYKETLQTYLRYVQQLPPQREWMTYKFGLRIRDLFDAKSELRIMAVGSGSGEVDVDFLKEIVKCGKERLGDNYSVVYQVVEPNPSNMECFRKAVTNNQDFKRIKFQWYNGFFEKFCDDFKQKEVEVNKFDFVHFVRVFYHIDSVKGLDRAYEHLLAKNGIMCAIGENENAFWPKMMHFLAAHKLEHECFTCSGPVSQNYFLPGWLQLARERDWRYESYVQGYKFDITPMYDPNSKDGNQLIDFALHAKDSRKAFKKEVIEDFFKLLDDGKIEREIIENEVKVTRKYFQCELGAIMITKD